LKSSTVFVSLAAAACIPAIVFAATASAESRQNGGGSGLPAHVYPAPTNLKVLPKDLTGEQVRAIMHQWEEALGVECATCHVRDSKILGPNGRPEFNYADDSKPENATARVMYTMVEDINANYISKIENSGIPVSCGTCHRGRVSPEPFTAGNDDKSVVKGPAAAEQAYPDAGQGRRSGFVLAAVNFFYRACNIRVTLCPSDYAAHTP
jgi:hypothetical protein